MVTYEETGEVVAEVEIVANAPAVIATLPRGHYGLKFTASPQMPPEGTAAASAAASAAHQARSEGLNSLFEPTAPAPSEERPAARSSFTGASAFSGSRTVPSRTLKVIKPAAYNDAEAVSTALKLGDAVVLCLVGTPDALSKRILDFSFGVASALDANVECVGNKVFALTRVNELSEAERSYLRSQGLV